MNMIHELAAKHVGVSTQFNIYNIYIYIMEWDMNTVVKTQC